MFTGKMKWMEQEACFPPQEAAAAVYQEVKDLSTKSSLGSQANEHWA